MGNRRYPVRVTGSWLQSIGAMIDGDAKIQATCTKCGRFKRFTHEDLVALGEKIGRDYCLINKRTRCRLKPGCDGVNRFYYLNGVYRPLWDEDVML